VSAGREEKQPQRGLGEVLKDPVLGIAVLALVPASLATEGIISRGSAIFLLVLSFLVILGGTFPWKTTLVHKVKFWLIAGLALGALGDFEWRNYAPPPTASEFAEEVGKKLQKPKIEPSISVECRSEPMPKEPSRDGYGYAVVFQNSTWMGLYSFRDPGGLHWIVNGKPQTAFACDVTNYGDEPLFEVGIDMDIVFEEAVERDDGSFQNGKTLSSTNGPIHIRKIDPQTGNAFRFYMFSYCQCFVFISLPNDAVAQMRGDTERHEITLINSSPSPMILYP
jgi:hypothetical protein